MILPDYLDYGLDAVFCGTAAGNRSAALRRYYAQPGNEFWATIYAVGLTPELLTPERDCEITKYRLGLTDLVKHHAGVDANLQNQMYDVKGFENKIREYAPRFVAFTSKKAAAGYLGVADTKEIDYGPQEGTIGPTRLFVLPSTSGNARRYWDAALWHELMSLIRSTES